MSKKIDIVYTWVDGSDPVWRNKRLQAMKDHGIMDMEQHGNVEGRFRDNGELKYSLRSVEKYFPNHGKIFIVTDNQVPDFLQLDERIKIIDHTDFMDEKSLPSFSSKNIISQIPKISEISEEFLLLNDDIFLGPDFHITDFFGDCTKFYFINSKESKIIPQMVSGISGEDVLKQRYSDYEEMKSYTVHTPKGVIKKDFFEMCREMPDILESVSCETFRDIKNPGIIGDLFSRWMVYKKRGTLGTKRDCYIQSSLGDYDRLIDNFQNIPFFCINDTSDNASKNSPSLLKISSVLGQLFPEKSSFEK